MKKTVRSALCAALVGVTALSTGCASRPETTLEVTWAAPQVPPAKSFGKLLIITVAPSEFVQETRLFDAKTGALAWTGLVDTKHNDKLDAAMTQYINVVFDAMVADKVL